MNQFKRSWSYPGAVVSAHTAENTVPGESARLSVMVSIPEVGAVGIVDFLEHDGQALAHLVLHWMEPHDAVAPEPGAVLIGRWQQEALGVQLQQGRFRPAMRAVRPIGKLLLQNGDRLEDLRKALVNGCRYSGGRPVEVPAERDIVALSEHTRIEIWEVSGGVAFSLKRGEDSVATFVAGHQEGEASLTVGVEHPNPTAGLLWIDTQGNTYDLRSALRDGIGSLATVPRDMYDRLSKLQTS